MYQGQGYYQEPDQRNRSHKKKKKKHRKLIFALELVLLLVVALGLFAFAQLSRVGRVNLKDIVINSGKNDVAFDLFVSKIGQLLESAENKI